MAMTKGVAGEYSSRRGNEYLVGLKPRADTAVATQVATAVKKQIDLDRQGTIVSGEFSDETVESLRQNPNVRYVEKNGRMEALGETVPYGIELTEADTAIDQGTTGNGVTISIVDTGIDAQHETLAENIVDGWAGPSAQCDANCGGWGFNTEINECFEEWDDDEDHGTHVAGTAAAAANNTGVLGVAPDASLLAVKALDCNGGGDFDDIADGITWSADNGADVINLSLGGPESNAVSDAVEYATAQGCVVVAAAGNDGPCSDCVSHPAAHPDVVAVSATDENDSLASFSSTGPEVDLAAPGAGVLSTVPRDDYTELSGTSMASPHVAGAAASVIASGVTDPDSVKSALEDGADDIGLSGNDQGAGRLNVVDSIDDDDDDDDDDDEEVSISVTTDSASDVGETSATLNGSLNTFEGTDEVELWFEYGTTAAGFTDQTGSGTFDEPTDVFADISGLDDGTNYQFRIVGAAGGEEVTGDTRTFTTEESGGGGCYITTAATRDDATLDSLRRFRDDSMASTPLGRGMIDLYYRISPPIAQTLSDHPDSRPTHATRWLVETCADISDRQEATDSRVESASLGVALTGLYMVGIATGVTGHVGLRVREKLGL